jgi:periplasmic protein CpxP/Spy
MKNLSSFSLPALVAAFLISGVAIAPMVMAQNTTNQNQTTTKQGRHGDPLSQLNLTADQTAQVKAIREQNQPNREANMQRIKQLKQEMQALMTSNAPNFQITAKHDEIQAVKQQMSKVRLDQMLKIRAILTPEQRQKLTQLSQNHRDKFRDQAGSRRPNSVTPNQVPN